MWKKMDATYMKFTFMLTMFLLNVVPASVFAATLDSGATNILTGRKGVDSTGSVSSVEWPWTRFLNSLAQELTGPLPLILGVLGITAAAIALFSGNGGAGTQKFIMLVCAVSVALFTPTLVTYISESARGATVDMVVNTVDTLDRVVDTAEVLAPSLWP